MNSENLKKMIILKFGSLQNCAAKLEITPSTLSRNLSNPSEKFIRKLKSLGVAVSNETIVDSVRAVISKDGVEGFIVKDSTTDYGKLLDEIKELKAENYDLKKKLEAFSK